MGAAVTGPVQVTLPAGEVVVRGPATRVNVAREILLSLLRVGVTSASLAAGQFALGERCRRAIAVRSLIGGVLTESSGLAMRAVEYTVDVPERLDVGILYSYGPTGARRVEEALRAVERAWTNQS